MNTRAGFSEGWNLIKLEHLLDRITNGFSGTQYDEKVGEAISRIETIWNETIDLSRVKYVKEIDAVTLDKYKIKRNDILFSHINSDLHLGKTAIFKNESDVLIHGINTLLLRPNSKISADFLNYQFKYLRKQGAFVAVAQKSVNQSSINQAKLKQLDIICPPLNEQFEIVEKMEELFSELDKGIESLKTAQQQLKVYRQAVLKRAFEGKLTNENVKEGELPDGWSNEKLGKFIKKPKYGTSKKCDYNPIGEPVLRIPNILNGKISIEDLKYAEFDVSEIENYRLQEGDLLIIRSNGSISIVGQTALIAKKEEGYLYAGYLICLRPHKDIISPKYLLHALSSSDLRTQIEERARSTSGVNNINTDEIKSLSLRICPIDEQERVVMEIESRLSVCDKMEETIIVSLQQAEALRQSILKSAFEGKLVANKKFVEYAI